MKFVGLLKCLLNEFAMSLLEVAMLFLSLIERLGSVKVGSLLFRDLIVLKYMF